MKKVLSLLIAFVFLQVQTWALSGGPNYSPQATFPNSIIGTYGGVMIPTSSTNTTVSTSATSIGLFSLAVTQSNLATGAAIIFVRGTAFIGQIAAMADADKKTIQGVFGGKSNFQVIINTLTGTTTTINPTTGVITTVQTFTNQSFDVNADGSFKLKVIEGDAGAFTVAPAGSGSGTTGSTSTTTTATTPTSLEVGSTNAARLQGTAQLDTFFLINATTGTPIVTETVTYSVDGVKQSNIPTAVTALNFNFG
jgi:hypothetical protein